MRCRLRDSAQPPFVQGRTASVRPTMQDGAPPLNAVVDAAIAARSETPALLREVAASIVGVAEIVQSALLSEKKVVLFGNGGSAAQAQHLAAELIGRFRRERGPFAAIALTADTSILTALANDYGYDEVFDRQLRALGQPGDVAVGLSTSGRSPNVLRAMTAAADIGMRRVALTGQAPNPLASDVEAVVAVPTSDVALVQEIHLAVIHILCAAIDERCQAGSTATRA